MMIIMLTITDWSKPELWGFIISLLSLVATIAIFITTLVINYKVNQKNKDWKKDLNKLITELRDNSTKSNELITAGKENTEVLKKTTESINTLIKELCINSKKLNETTQLIYSRMVNETRQEQREKIKNSWMNTKVPTVDVKKIQDEKKKDTAKLKEIEKKWQIRKNKGEKIKNSQKTKEFLKNKKK